MLTRRIVSSIKCKVAILIRPFGFHFAIGHIFDVKFTEIHIALYARLLVRSIPALPWNDIGEFPTADVLLLIDPPIAFQSIATFFTTEEKLPIIELHPELQLLPVGVRALNDKITELRVHPRALDDVTVQIDVINGQFMHDHIEGVRVLGLGLVVVSSPIGLRHLRD